MALFSLVVLLMSACSVHRKMTAIHYRDYINPPNQIVVDSNLYCDETEIKNLDWLEYLYWISRIYGKTSMEYKEALPDTSVWGMDSCNIPYVDYYLRHPATRDYPVVGVSQEQASLFSVWRSDRVFQQILLKTNIIEFDTNQTFENFFTIKKYYSGNYKGVEPNFEIPYPNFRLPTIIERKRILSYSDSLRKENKVPRKQKKEYSLKYGTVNYKRENDLIPGGNNRHFLSFVWEEYASNTKEPLLHLRGNVAEWSSEPNICFGGSWKDSFETIISNDIYEVSDSVNTFTGFRNVCEWKYWNDK